MVRQDLNSVLNLLRAIAICVKETHKTPRLRRKALAGYLLYVVFADPSRYLRGSPSMNRASQWST